MEQRLLALPVVDETGRLTGIVDVSAVTQRLFELERREAADELFQMVGLHANQQTNRGFWRVLMSRFSWLLMSVAAGLLAAAIMKVFHTALRRVVDIAFFVPCVVTVAGSVAMQAVTMSLQNLHIARRKNYRILVELPGAVVSSAICALLAGVLVARWLGPPVLAFVVSCSLLTACISGAVLGYFIPRLVHRWRLGPQIASGPVVLALTYLAALASYLALSAALI